MTRKRFFRGWALFAILALGAAQVAMAAFAPLAAQPEMVAMMDGGDCHGEPAATHLCVKTCQAEPASPDTPSLDVPPYAVQVALRVDPVERVLPARDAPAFPALARATSPPPRLLFARFLE